MNTSYSRRWFSHVREVTFSLLLLVSIGELRNLMGTILGGQSGENISLEQVSVLARRGGGGGGA